LLAAMSATAATCNLRLAAAAAAATSSSANMQISGDDDLLKDK